MGCSVESEVDRQKQWSIPSGGLLRSKGDQCKFVKNGHGVNVLSSPYPESIEDLEGT